MGAVLSQIMPFEALDVVYQRATVLVLADPGHAKQMMNAHDFVAAWRSLQEEAKEQVKRNQREMERLRDEDERQYALAHPLPRTVKHISEWARDTPRPDALIRGQERRGEQSPDRPTSLGEQLTKAQAARTDAERAVQEQRNRDAWNALANQGHLVNKTEEELFDDE